MNSLLSKFFIFSPTDGHLRHQLHPRPLPDIPPVGHEDSGLGFSSSLDNSIRWASRENLLMMSSSSAAAANHAAAAAAAMANKTATMVSTASSANTDDDPQLYVALYDFQSGGENQLSLKKGNNTFENFRTMLF